MISPDCFHLLPDQKQVEFYKKFGYFISEKINTDQELDAAIEGIDIKNTTGKMAVLLVTILIGWGAK